MKSAQSGFTITELMVVVAIVAILLAIGAPSYRYVTTANRISSEVNGLLGDLQYARAEAIKEGQTVSVCASTDSATCSGTSNWQTGWIVFIDQGAIGTVDAATDTILRKQAQFKGTDTLVPDNALPAVTFNRAGFAVGLPNAGVTLQLHDSTNNNAYTRCLQLTIIGAMTTQMHGQGNC